MQSYAIAGILPALRAGVVRVRHGAALGYLHTGGALLGGEAPCNIGMSGIQSSITYTTLESLTHPGCNFLLC